jgi:ERCC4-related helicase
MATEKEKKMRESLSKQATGLGGKAKGMFADTLVSFMTPDQKQKMFDKAQEKFANHPKKEEILSIMKQKLGIEAGKK